MEPQAGLRVASAPMQSELSSLAASACCSAAAADSERWMTTRPALPSTRTLAARMAKLRGRLAPSTLERRTGSSTKRLVSAATTRTAAMARSFSTSVRSRVRAYGRMTTTGQCQR